MACNIQLVAFNGLVPSGQGNPTQLRVTGRASQCQSGQVVITSSITAPVTVPILNTGDFVANIPIIGTVLCGQALGFVRVECHQHPACAVQEQNVALPCCDVSNVLVRGVTPAGMLDPTQIVVTGTVLGCISNQVVVRSSVTAPSAPASVDPVNGAFSVTLPVTTPTKCDGVIEVSAECHWPTPPASPTPVCTGGWKGQLFCADCARAQVSYTTAPCTGAPPRQPVTLHAIISVPAGATRKFRWEYGDTTVGPDFTVNNTTGTGGTQYSFTEPPHSYAPGNYTARLTVVPPPSECTDFPIAVTAVCIPNCPSGTITIASEGPCINGTRTLTFNATVTAAAGVAAVGQWNYGHAPPHGPLFVVPAGTTQDHTSNTNLTAQHAYPTGPHRVELDISAMHPGCPNPFLEFTVSPCVVTCEVLLDYQPKPIPCLPSGGSVNVNFTATLNPPNAGYSGPFTWEVTRNGTSIAKTTQSGPSTASPHLFSYPFSAAGTYDVTVTIATPGCDHPFDTAVVQVVVQGCCPVITSLTGQTVSPCTAIFTAQVTNPGNAPVTFDWAFHDGSTAQTTTPVITHTYPLGGITTGTTTVTLNSPGCPPSVASATATIMCFCPVVGTPVATVTGCAPGGSPSVALSTTVSGPPFTGVDWTVTDPSGATFTKTTAGASTTDGTGDGAWSQMGTTNSGPLPLGTPGSFAVTAKAKGPAIDPTCNATSAPRSFTVPPCGAPDEGLGCRIARWLGVILLILAGLALMIALCVLVPPHCVLPFCPQAQAVMLGVAAGLALAGLIVLAIWFFLCPIKPCGWGWLLAGQVLLGVGAIALHFTPCCPVLWIIGGVAILIAIYFFWRWVRKCRISRCVLAAEISIVLATVVLPFIAGIGKLPIIGVVLMPCISGVVNLVFIIISGLLAMFIASCVVRGQKL